MTYFPVRLSNDYEHLIISLTYEHIANHHPFPYFSFTISNALLAACNVWKASLVTKLPQVKQELLTLRTRTTTTTRHCRLLGWGSGKCGQILAHTFSQSPSVQVSRPTLLKLYACLSDMQKVQEYEWLNCCWPLKSQKYDHALRAELPRELLLKSNAFRKYKKL